MKIFKTLFAKKNFYAVVTGQQNSIICRTWSHCEQLTKSFSNAKFRGFKTLSEAEAFLIAHRERQKIALQKKEYHRFIPEAASPGSCELSSSAVKLFTDGCCLSNGRDYELRVGGIGVFFGVKDSRNISESFIEENVTNNRAELFAVIRALETVKPSEDVEIFTDSKYVITLHDRKLSEIVTNRDLWKRFLSLVSVRQGKLKFTWVRGHSSSFENSQADQLAVTAAKRQQSNGFGVVHF